MDNVVIASVNVRGIQDKHKRADIFNWLKEKKCSIYCIQDFHLRKEQENEIETEWGYTCLFSSYKTNARGTAILFNDNFEFKINKVKSDENGNYIAIDISCGESRFTLISIYGPNEDNELFFVKLTQIAHEFENSSICRLEFSIGL
jgi:exonuclease III